MAQVAEQACGGTAPVILFDGHCHLCSWAVTFVVDRDPACVFRFASLQSASGQALLMHHGLCSAGVVPDSVVLIDGERAYTLSTAALRIAARLRWPWRWLAWGLVVPRAMRDPVYRWVAAHRYLWFGRDEVCRVPTDELRRRLLP